ncbi:hypothetical protein [Flavivirga spongiicola]|uniref:Uncharacterized protein n=1 Tax=Flavivirga spongiicola TaxID=421621 RepID=A0ABU7XYG2_9FLAO|nr:hypothetical protein [Flavivirga sp. MEBiC05379]MDO5980817.1 hypothetical protein [Flavivirga sp. MEBiC05379]
MKKTVILLLIVLFVLPIQAQSIKKSDLKVLYVGQNPETPNRYMFANSLGDKIWKEDIIPERAKVFHEFFQKYFNTVDLVYGEEYNEGLTKKYDVVVFDAVPRQLNGELTESGWDLKYISDNYDKPTILIAGVAGPILSEKKSKIQVLCNCLDSHAYYFDENHPVFSTPYKLPIKTDTEMRAPNQSVHVYFSGRNLPEKMPMLKMQDVDLKKYPPGIVALPGFDDSPDAETIACGPSIKMVEAVSIGRHGNFFQWGYRADPRHLTESGKLALINSIHYISNFKGQKPFVKRLKQPRSLALNFVYSATDKAYTYEIKNKLKSHDRLNSAKIKELGGTLKEENKYILNYETKLPDRAYYLQQVPKQLLQKFGDDWNAYLSYYEANAGYMGLRKEITDEKTDGFLKIMFDKDLQNLGIANNDIKLLDTCIFMLKSNDRPELAQRLLLRYTQETFTTVKLWQKWFKKNRDKLFFTETGGYKWMINTIRDK